MINDSIRLNTSNLAAELLQQGVGCLEGGLAGVVEHELVARVPPPKWKDFRLGREDRASSVGAKLIARDGSARRPFDPSANESGIVPRDEIECGDGDNRNCNEHRSTPSPIVLQNRGGFALELRVTHPMMAKRCTALPYLLVAKCQRAGHQRATSSSSARSIAAPAWADRRCRHSAPPPRCWPRREPLPQTERIAVARRR